MRLFICIDIEKDQLDVLEKLKEDLKKESKKGRFAKREHMHLTLNFLGEVEDERLEDVIQAMERVYFKNFKLYMSGLGWFQKRSGKIYWVGLERSEKLLKLQKDLHDELLDLGFELEKREYTPHITIGRDVRVADDFNPSRYTEIVQGMPIKVEGINLKRSENKGSGVIHTTLYSRGCQGQPKNQGGEELIRVNLMDKKEYMDDSKNHMRKDLIEGVRNFHKGFSEYSTTPLHSLRELSDYLGVKSIHVKDESKRFGLNAFKVLGGSYAIGKYLAQRLQMDIGELDFDYLKSREVREKIGELTFVTATDGNHGRGVAWAARELGQKCVVYMPKGSSETRLQNIRNEGAEASIIDGNYNNAVKLSDKMAKEHGWIVVQDTAWKGYEEIPTWIMQGYGTIMDEVVGQLENEPTHVFLQAGVGSFAGAMLGYLLSHYGNSGPKIYIVEPDEANCLYLSSLAGEIRVVDGDMATIMAGLACGEPNTVSWPMIRDYSDGFISCPDYVAAKGMRIMAASLSGDPQIVSGESGAVGLGLLSYLMERDEYRDAKEGMGLGKDSRILIISTEGDTDPVKYREIVWDGTESEK